MLRLPKLWERMIQVRPFMKPANSFGEIALLLFMVKNDADQYFAYEKPVKVPAIEEMSRAKELENAFSELLYVLPGVAAEESMALSTRQIRSAKHEPIKSQNWEMLKSPDLVSYEDYLKELTDGPK